MEFHILAPEEVRALGFTDFARYAQAFQAHVESLSFIDQADPQLMEAEKVLRECAAQWQDRLAAAQRVKERILSEN